MCRQGSFQLIFAEVEDRFVRLKVYRTVRSAVEGISFLPVRGIPDQEAITSILRMSKVENILDDLKLEIRYQTSRYTGERWETY